MSLPWIPVIKEESIMDIEDTVEREMKPETQEHVISEESADKMSLPLTPEIKEESIIEIEEDDQSEMKPETEFQIQNDRTVTDPCDYFSIYIQPPFENIPGLSRGDHTSGTTPSPVSRRLSTCSSSGEDFYGWDSPEFPDLLHEHYNIQNDRTVTELCDTSSLHIQPLFENIPGVSEVDRSLVTTPNAVSGRLSPSSASGEDFYGWDSPEIPDLHHNDSSELLISKESADKVSLQLIPVVMLERIKEIENIIKRDLSPETQDLKLRITDDSTSNIGSKDTHDDLHTVRCSSAGTNDVLYPTLYVCDICNKCFDDVIILTDHACLRNIREMLGETLQNKKNPCLKCGKCYSGAGSFDIDSTSDLCNSCSVSVASETPSIQHLQPHLQKQVETVQNSDLNKHNVINSFTKTLQCTSYKRFSHKSHLNTDTLVHSSTKNHYCKFSRRSNRYRHMLVHSGTKNHHCTLCNKSFSLKSYLNKHMVVHSGKKNYHCAHCKQSFSRSSTLYRHMVVHSGTKNHHCTVCNKRFSQKEYLNSHMLIHSGTKKHCCTLCNKRFALKSSLNTHMLVHSGTRNHHCTFCNKSFTLKTSLNVHMLVHSGTRNYHCAHCNKSFSRRGTLKRHMLVHSAIKNHHCKLCNQSFSLKGNLTTHMLLHSGTKNHCCTLCNKSFSLKSYLKTHMLVHSGTRNHHCTFCNNSFLLKSHLNTHMLIHSGKKNYQCAHCKKGFLRRSSLNRHIILLHSGTKTASVIPKIC